MFIFIFISLLLSLTEPTAKSSADGGVLLAKPRLSVEEAEHIARTFIGESDCQLNYRRTYVARGSEWTPKYEFDGSHLVSVDARTGRVTGVMWRKRNHQAPIEVGREPLTAEETARIARAFIGAHYPGFDQSFMPEVPRLTRNGTRRQVTFNRQNGAGVRVGQGASVDIGCATGEVLLYSAFYRDLALDAAPAIKLEDAIAAARRLIAYAITTSRGDLLVEQDALGDQCLAYTVYLTGPVELPAAGGGKATRQRTVPVTVDAQTGEVLHVYMGDWSLTTERPPLTRPFRSGPFVKFRHHGVELIKRPMVRGEHVLISRLLFEGLGAKIAFEEASGKLVLEKAADPIVCTVGSLDATQDGEPFQLPVPPEVVNGHPYLPVVLVTRLLGMPVRWDAEKDRLYIDCEGRPEPE